MIAHYLARDEGDTLGVMQAVLDTTFWLATHVVCITLGYAGNVPCGNYRVLLLPAIDNGAFIVVRSRPKTDFSAAIKQCGKLVYGTLCFALFFSLVGTVLGGLWGGRFLGTLLGLGSQGERCNADRAVECTDSARSLGTKWSTITEPPCSPCLAIS